MKWEALRQCPSEDQIASGQRNRLQPQKGKFIVTKVPFILGYVLPIHHQWISL